MTKADVSFEEVFPLPKEFCYARYRVTLVPEETIDLPAFKGSALRGAFGRAFRRICCALGRDDCSGCMLDAGCPYALVFETRPPHGSEKLSKNEGIPRPYIFEPPLDGKVGSYRPGQELRFNLTLVGRAVEFLAHFLVAFQDMGRRGLGRGRGRFRLAEVRGLLPGGGEPVLIYDETDRIVHRKDVRVFPWQDSGVPEQFPVLVRYRTPTRIKVGGRFVEKPSFEDLVRALLRRVSSLSYFHCGAELDIDFRAEIDRAALVDTRSSELSWVPLERYSGRQDRHIAMSGIVGEQVFTGKDLPHFSTLLNVGAVVHIGKGAVFGLGEIEVSSVPEEKTKVDTPSSSRQGSPKIQ